MITLGLSASFVKGRGYFDTRLIRFGSFQRGGGTLVASATFCGFVLTGSKWKWSEKKLFWHPVHSIQNGLIRKIDPCLKCNFFCSILVKSVQKWLKTVRKKLFWHPVHSIQNSLIRKIDPCLKCNFFCSILVKLVQKWLKMAGKKFFWHSVHSIQNGLIRIINPCLKCKIICRISIKFDPKLTENDPKKSYFDTWFIRFRSYWFE